MGDIVNVMKKELGAEPDRAMTLELIGRALREDAPDGDLTTIHSVSARARARAMARAKERMVLAGVDLFARVFKHLNRRLKIDALKNDAAIVEPGDAIVSVEGNARAILTGERVALNFLQRLSGVATLTRSYQERARAVNPNIKILDTRKTTPLLRSWEKYAVRVGGGFNHRGSLSEMALIKDNHIAAAGGIESAVEKIRAALGRSVFVEVEVRSIAQVKIAARSQVDRILLDNMDYKTAARALKIIDRKKETEISGGMTLERVARFAKLPVDYISVGALTHSAPAVDISLNIELGSASGRALSCLG